MSIAVDSLQPKIVIIGGGLQGCSTAYWLKQKASSDIEVTIIERTGIAAAASGKGGGFLARNWGRGVTEALHEKSFDLLEDLAQTLPLKSYRKLPTLQVTGELGLREWPPQKKTSKPIKRSPAHPEWLDATDTKAKLLESHEGSAQVNPAELCEQFFKHSEAHLITSAARGFEFSPNDNTLVTGVKTDQGIIPCDQVVVAAGIWSVLLEDWLPNFRLPMEGIYSTSVIFDDKDGKINQAPSALFCAEDSNSCHLEVYPRSDGTVYICGIGGSEHVTKPRLREGGDLDDAAKMKANSNRVEAAKKSISALVPDFSNVQPRATNACMRPCAPDALPIIGKTESAKGVFIATGGNCWGILWSAITGHIIADLLLHKTPVVENLESFSPDRFMPRASARGRAKGQVQRW